MRQPVQCHLYGLSRVHQGRFGLLDSSWRASPYLPRFQWGVLIWAGGSASKASAIWSGAEAEYARQQGYTMTLVVDHRTQINDPQIQQMIDSGQIQLVRKELDDNNDL